MKFLLKSLFAILLLAAFGCKEESHGPYDPHAFEPKMTAKINNYNFEIERITIFVPEDNNSFIGVNGRDSLYRINIGFPEDCGEKTFYLPDSDDNTFILFNGESCKNGILVIEKYDVNLVEGNFQFEIETDSTINVTRGKFSIVYPTPD